MSNLKFVRQNSLSLDKLEAYDESLRFEAVNQSVGMASRDREKRDRQRSKDEIQDDDRR